MINPLVGYYPGVRTSLGHGVALVEILVGARHGIGAAAVGLGLIFHLRYGS